MASRKFWIPLIASFIVTPIALLLGVGSGGAGHGDYRLAMILFPYTMLSTTIFDSITPPFILLAIIQFPLYGVILGRASEKGRFVSICILLCVVHCLALTAMFLVASKDFHDSLRVADNRLWMQSCTIAETRTELACCYEVSFRYLNRQC